ncbi:hypothetical protein [Pseudolabrys sp.]|uniref:hypothetical protein n=1 Tax=Pseudolabrys sp. TaxID=1960880 RepID=UPI003D0CCC84
MTISAKHNFQSAKSDGTDNTLVQPSNWNEEHVITMATDRVLGRTTAGDGAVEELDAAALRTLLAIATQANTFTAKQTFSDFLKLQRALEKVNIVADNPASGDNNIDILTASIHYFTTNTDTDWGLNIRGDGSNSLDSLMATGETVSLAVMVTNGSTAYKQNSFKIDGSAVTPEWLGSPAPDAGTPSKRDTYQFTIIKTGSATFIVQASFASGN